MVYFTDQKTDPKPILRTPEEKMAAIVRGVRAELNVSQTELGVRIGRNLCIPAIPQGTISDWEIKGNVPGCYLGAIAQVCGVPAERMMV